MKKSSICFMAVAGMLLAVASYAATPKLNQFCLYQSTSLKSKCIQRLNINTPMVGIVNKGKWTKIGLRDDNGTTGWIYRPNYQRAQNVFYQPNIQTVYIQKERNKDGKMIVNVVAYKNGKKVTDKQATAIYNKIRKEQWGEDKAAQQADYNMRTLFRRQFDMMDRMFDDENQMMFRVDSFDNTLPPLNDSSKKEKS